MTHLDCLAHLVDHGVQPLRIVGGFPLTVPLFHTAKRHDEMLLNQALGSDRAGLIMATSKFIRMSLQIMILAVGAYLAIRIGGRSPELV